MKRISERWLKWGAVCLWSEDVVDCLCWLILDLMLMCCSVCGRERVESKRGEDGQIIPSAWWDWMLGLIDCLIIGGNGPENEWDSALGLLWSWLVGLERMLAAERHVLNVHGTWFHLCLIYSYMILAKWSNKKEEGESERGCKSSFIAEILLFHPIWNGCCEKRARIKIHLRLKIDGIVGRFTVMDIVCWQMRNAGL